MNSVSTINLFLQIGIDSHNNENMTEVVVIGIFSLRQGEAGHVYFQLFSGNSAN